MTTPHQPPLYSSLDPLASLEHEVLAAAAAAVAAAAAAASSPRPSQPPPTSPILYKSVLSCPRWMVGRLIGKNGSTIKGIQLATNAVVEVDQLVEPTQVTIVGNAASVMAAENMVNEIIAGRFRGFAPVQDFLESCNRRPGSMVVYAPGLGVLVSRDASK